MKKSHLLLTALAISSLTACKTTPQSPVSLQWEMGENQEEPGFYGSTFTLVNTSDKPLETGWEIYYTQLSPRQVKNYENSPVTIEMVNPGYYKMTPADSWQPLAPGDSIAIPYLNKGTLTQTRFSPKAPFFVAQNGVCFLQQEEAIDSHRKLSHYFSDVGFYQAAIPTYYGGIMTFAWATDM